MAKELSRRNFLKGAAAGATGLGITGILNQYAGIATPIVKAEESSEETQINWTDAADMIVVGGGGTGFTAAIEAARAGSSVIILEKVIYAAAIQYAVAE